MDRRRALACMTLVAGLTFVQAAPAFADGSAGPAPGPSATATSDSTENQSAESTPADAAPKDEPTEATAADTPTSQTTKADAHTSEAKPPTPTSGASTADASKTDAPKADAPKRDTATSQPTSEGPTREPAPSAPAARASTAKVAAPSARVTRLADEPSPLSVTLTATAVDVNGDGRQGAGDAIDVTATVRATGPSDIGALVVAPTATGDSTVFTCPVTTVLPGTDVACTARHELTQADVDAGHVTLTAAATGTIVGTSTTSAPATLDVTATGTTGLAVKQTITQRSDADRDGRLDAGDLVDVRVTVTNTGTVTLERLTISDSLLTRLHVTVTCAATTLAPGASTTCTSARFAVTRSQATARVLRNQATATARTPSGSSVKSLTSTASVAVQAPTSTRPSRPTSPKPSGSTAVARLRMSQWVASVTDHDKDGRLDAGDAITFGFRASNVGSLTVYDLRVVDRRLQRAGVSVHCPVSSLAPGTSVVCMSGPVAVTVHQAQKGFGRNFAFVTGRTSAGTTVRSNSSVTDVGRTAQSAQAAALPRTGSDLADPVMLGLALLLGGVTMTVVSRHRPARGIV